MHVQWLILNSTTGHWPFLCWTRAIEWVFFILIIHFNILLKPNPIYLGWFCGLYLSTQSYLSHVLSGVMIHHVLLTIVSHVFISLPFLVPWICIHTLYRSCFLSYALLPNHLKWHSKILSSIGANHKFLCIFSFLIPPFLVTPHIHLGAAYLNHPSIVANGTIRIFSLMILDHTLSI